MQDQTNQTVGFFIYFFYNRFRGSDVILIVSLDSSTQNSNGSPGSFNQTPFAARPAFSSTPNNRNQTRTIDDDLILKLIYEDKRGKVYKSAFLFHHFKENDLFLSEELPNVVIDVKRSYANHEFEDDTRAQVEIRLLEETMSSRTSCVESKQVGVINAYLDQEAREKVIDWNESDHQVRLLLQRS